MSRFANAISSKVRGSPIFIILYIALILAFAISCVLSFEDYSTSKLGYAALPTTKANVWIIPIVALLPQVLQVVAFFYGIEKRNSQLMMVFVIMALFDCATDVYFKQIGHGWVGVLVAIPETLLLYTFGSEILFVFSGAQIIEDFPEFLTQLKTVSAKLFASMGFGVDGEPEKQVQFGRDAHSQPQNWAPPQEQPQHPGSSPQGERRQPGPRDPRSRR